MSRSKRVLLPYRQMRKVRPYEEAARAAGIEPVPTLAEGVIRLGDVAGLLLMGGSDVDPNAYGESRGPHTDEPDTERDKVELALIDEAIEKDIPILAICRGLQILNVFHGGNLIQHLHNHPHHDPDPSDSDTSAPVHQIHIAKGTRLFEIAGQSSWAVNSRHHQAVKTPGQYLAVSARDPEDGTIEALERPDKSFVVAVQWHPEDQVFAHPQQLRLFHQFANALR